MANVDTAEAVHVCNPETCPEPATYYVTAMDGKAWWALAGPYNTHREALTDVEKVREICCRIDPRAVFMAFGTIRDKDNERKPGKLNILELL